MQGFEILERLDQRVPLLIEIEREFRSNNGHLICLAPNMAGPLLLTGTIFYGLAAGHGRVGRATWPAHDRRRNMVK